MVLRRVDADAKARLQELQAEVAVLKDHIEKLKNDSNTEAIVTKPGSHNAGLTDHAPVHESATHVHGESGLSATSDAESAQISKNAISVCIYGLLYFVRSD